MWESVSYNELRSITRRNCICWSSRLKLPFITLLQETYYTLCLLLTHTHSFSFSLFLTQLVLHGNRGYAAGKAETLSDRRHTLDVYANCPPALWGTSHLAPFLWWNHWLKRECWEDKRIECTFFGECVRNGGNIWALAEGGSLCFCSF